MAWETARPATFFIARIGDEGEALRDADRFSHVAAWEFNGVGETPIFHKEPLVFETVALTQRSYK